MYKLMHMCTPGLFGTFSYHVSAGTGLSPDVGELFPRQLRESVGLASWLLVPRQQTIINCVPILSDPGPFLLPK
jgi:hypothetical protein